MYLFGRYIKKIGPIKPTSITRTDSDENAPENWRNRLSIKISRSTQYILSGIVERRSIKTSKWPLRERWKLMGRTFLFSLVNRQLLRSLLTESHYFSITTASGNELKRFLKKVCRDPDCKKFSSASGFCDISGSTLSQNSSLLVG